MRKRRKLNKDGKLNSQQWGVYNYLKKYGKTDATTLAGACGYEYDLDSQKRNLSRISMFLYEDVNFINESTEIEKTIVWQVEKGVLWYWIAESYDDVKEFVNRIYFKPASNKFKKAWGLLKKAEMNGQGKCIDTRGNVIDVNTVEARSSARRFVESYMNRIFVD